MPVRLVDAAADAHASAQAELDAAINLPAGSALTIAEVDPATGTLHALHWRGTGEMGFYPASSVKLATAVMTLRQLQALNLPTDVQLQLGEQPAQRVDVLLRDMIADSDNDAFNTLQEAAGFAETHAWLQEMGCVKGIIRRHFTRPHWNHSRAVEFSSAGGGAVAALAARPAVDLPLNADPNHPAAGAGQANWFCTDDLVRLAAATFFGPTRDLPGFGLLADAAAETNEQFVGRGLDELAPGRYASFNKPGWWPEDGANVDVAYVFDRRTGRHFLLGVYFQGELPDARAGLRQATATLFGKIDAGQITFGVGSAPEASAGVPKSE